MKRVVYILIFILSVFTGKVAGQCVDIGPAMTGICQGGTSAGLGGGYLNGTTSAIWSSTAGGSFLPNVNDLNATWTPPPAYSGTATLTLTALVGCSSSPAFETKTIVVTPNPTVNVGGAMADICQGGTSAALGGSVGGSATGGTWSTPAGGTFAPDATDLNATWTPPGGYSGTATLTLTTSGGSCGTTSDNKSIIVIPNPTANAGGAMTAICEGGTSAALGGSVGGSATGGTWSTPAGGTFTPGATDLNATWSPPGGYTGTATLTLTTSGGSCGTTSDNKTIVVNQIPTANAGGAMTAFCQGGTSAALGGSVGGSATGGTWSTPEGGSFTPNATDLNATWTPPGGYNGTATLTLTTSGGLCTAATDSKNIVVTPNPTVNVGGAMAAICQGGTSAALGGSVGGSATGGTWSTPDGGTFTPDATDLNATWTPPGAYFGTATLTLTTSGGSCGTTSANKNIIVNANPTVNAGAAIPAFCQGGTSAALGGSVGGSATGGTWSTPAGGSFSPGATNLNATWTPPGGYNGTATLTLTTSGGSCGNVTDSKNIVVNPLPVPGLSGPTPVCITSTGNIYSTESGMSNYIWTVSGGGATTSGGGTGDNTVTVTWNNSGAQTVKVSYTNGNGCIAAGQTTYNVTVDPKPLPTNVVISGVPREYATLTVSYDYVPGTCFPEDLSLTEISWYRANNPTGGSPSFITTKSGLDKTYVVSTSDYNKYIEVRVKLSDGTTLMSPVTSPTRVGPVAHNEKPVASAVSFSGTLEVNSTLTGIYTYSDAESDPEGATTYEWYRADNGSGSNSTKITGATSQTYALTTGERNKYMRFRVIPKATSGTTPGDAVSSSWVGPVVDNPPVASSVTITGTARVGNVLTGHYQYSDAEGDLEGVSTYQWYTGTNSSGAGSSAIGGANSISYTLTNNEFGDFIGFSVTPVAQDGTSPGTMVTTTTWVGPVINDPPLASSLSITGSLNVNGALTGHYVYSDVEGDLESGSTYRWFSASTLAGPYSVIPGETGIAHVITMSEQGYYFKFEVTPKTLTGSPTGTPVLSSEYGKVNTKPFADNLLISGTAAIGSTLTGSYNYNDIDLDLQGTSTFRWLRNGTVPIPGATSITYLITSADEGEKISFEVTPVSSTGYPDTGTPVLSAETANVIDPSVLAPVASEVCIEGTSEAGEILRGKYLYTFYKSEGVSAYKWMRNGFTIGTGLQYTLTQPDIDSGEEITFEVTPKSSNYVPKIGIPVISNPLARITLPQDEYSVAVDTVTLSANQTGGVFSGPGVTNGIFSPSSVGTTGSPYTIQYLLNIVNPSLTCSQTASKDITVVTNTTSFIGFNTVYCHDSGPDVITVTGIPPLSTSWGFYLTNPAGIVSQTAWTVTIDPGLMRPGNNVDVLYFYYLNGGYFYRITQPFVIDSVGTDIKIINLNPAYCKSDAIQDISVLGAYPAGGTGAWSGSILSGLNATSASVEPQTGTAGITYPITYQYTTPNGCLSEILTQNVTINPLPNPNFTLDPTYNIDGGEKTLIPVQTGGSFSGNGISGSRIFPDIAGLGEHTITYSITDANNCSDTKALKTTIRKSQGNFVDLPAIICYRDTTYNVKITGLPAGATANSFINTRNSIVHIPGATDADYNVPAAGAGIDTLTFSYKWDAVDYDISTIVNIDSLGQVVIQNLAVGDIICNNVAPFELFTSYNGGVFTGPVTGGYLDPSKALGATAISYKYTNQKTGCFTSINIPFIITAVPVISFVPADYCIETGSDSTRFVNTTTSGDFINDWLWEFTDAGQTKTSYKKEPAYLYTTGGVHPVTLTAKTTTNCIVTKTIPVDLGVKPFAEFRWENECYHPNDSIKLFDASVSASTITTRTWNFFDGGALKTDKNPKYPKSSAGYLPVQYIVNTSYANCSDTISKNIYIRPSVSLAADDYFQDFESGNAGWVKDDALINSWTFGKPGRTVINSAASGNNAWYTNYTMTNQKIESSSVISPCFDFTVSERPMINLKLFRRFDRDRDGTVLQYKVGDIGTWQPVGTLEDGINWYNSTLIKGRPGGDQLGWTTKGLQDTKWSESRHTLDELKGKKDVKFRLAYGSDGTSVENEGIAFDDIWIGERTRNVLLEHFTNTSSSKSSEATVFVNSISNDKKKDVINIQYHTNFPGTDPYYDSNPGDASARILFYGLIKTPYSFLDGGTRKDYANIYDYVLADIDSNDITRRSLVNPVFDISLTTVVSGGILSVSGKLTALEAISSDNITLYLAVTEKENDDHTGANGEKKFYNVFRKFIPDGGGINLKKTWTKGEVFTLAEWTWPIEKVLNSADIEVVAFVQNSVTKELYQAASQIKKAVLTGIEKMFRGKGSDFALYPNPAVDRLTVTFEKPLVTDADIRIYDLQGVIVRSYKAGSGSTEFTVTNPELRGGIYMVRVTAGGIDLGFKKLIITGD